MILCICILLSAIDFCLKNYIFNNLNNSDEIATIIPFLKIVKVENHGVAFGLFKNHNFIVIFLTLVLISFLSFIILKKKIKRDASYTLAFSFMLAGAIGNLIDRIFYGFVIDYLKLTFFPPVCNLSDYMICFSAMILIFNYIKEN